MNIKRNLLLTALISTSIALSACATTEQPIDYQALGEEACRDNGGLLYIDKINAETAFYECASGMNYKIKKPSPSSEEVLQ